MLALLLAAQAAATPPTPSEIVARAPAASWVTIRPDDLLVMELASDRDRRARRIVIQLVPPPFSQSWVANIATLAKARWWDGTSINRVQDNYVVQWGDATEKKPLPAGLNKMGEGDYSLPFHPGLVPQIWSRGQVLTAPDFRARRSAKAVFSFADPYAQHYAFAGGMPLAVAATARHDFRSGWSVAPERLWPIHCYGSVGVGRGLSPDAGSGAELYTVIGHAPRHLDRNIAVVGRVVEGIEHLSSLPRDTEALGFYRTAAERVPIRSVRLASDLPEGERPRLQYLSTESASFVAYANARANRRDPFFIRPAGGADICNVPVPVRRAP